MRRTYLVFCFRKLRKSPTFLRNFRRSAIDRCPIKEDWGKRAVEADFVPSIRVKYKKLHKEDGESGEIYHILLLADLAVLFVKIHLFLIAKRPFNSRFKGV